MGYDNRVYSFRLVTVSSMIILKNINEFYKRQIEYEFEHLCFESHWLSQCFLNSFYKTFITYLDTKVKI
jgi:hypothetical protein